MKRFLIFTLAIFLIQNGTTVSLAEETNSQPEVSNIFLENPESQEDVEIYLEQQPQEEKYDADITIQEKPHEMINLKLPQSIVSKSLFEYKNAKIKNTDPTLYLRASKYSTSEYTISPISSSLYNKLGAFSYGTTYDEYVDTAQLENSTKFFTRYDTKRFAFSGAYGKTLLTNTGYTKDYLCLSPEIKLGKGFALRDTLRHEVGQNRQKNEVVLLYRPNLKNHNNSNMQFELGAGRTFYEGQDSTNSVRFSTSFKL